ncbi:MAG: adenylate/guanylate cyclase domain-containing protein [Candidatus Ozemobacteraceae bacterium]
MMPFRRRILLFVVLFAAVWYLPWTDDLERWSIDQRFQWRGNRSPPTDTVIIGIDAASVAWAKRPFSIWNPLYAEFLQAMNTASASTVMLDLLFQTSLDGEIRRMVGDVLTKNNIPLSPPVLSKIGFDRPLRQALLETQRAGLHVVLGFVADTDRPLDLVPELRAIVPQECLGFFNVDSDPDQVVRAATLFGRDRITGTLIPSADIAVAASRLGVSFRVASDGTPMLGDRPIDRLFLGRQGRIDYVGPMKSFPFESFKDVLIDAREHPEKLSRFAGKTVLVGVWMLEDNKRIPLRGFMSGIEIHANILENIVNNRFLKTSPQWLPLAAMLIFAFIQFFAFGRNLKTGLILTFLLGGGWITATLTSFNRVSLLLPFAKPLLVIFCSALLEGARLFHAVDKERRLVRSVFQRYVNDSVVEMILKAPRDEIMRGSRRQICVLFSDIRGFTTFSESRSPQEVVAFLNVFLSGLTDIILRHDGVVDKFLGDGMMAFFNAPIDRPGYVHQAVEAALEIRAFVLKEEIRAAAAPFELKVGVALHLGDAVVGNLGSERKMEFTAIGDTVNTTSRLESLNKEYGTDIIASNPTAELTSDCFIWRDLGETAVRGKERSVRIFALVGEKNAQLVPAKKENEK